MKLNTNKRLMLCSKALYSEQLKCYASLCECYQALSKQLGPKATSLDVQKRYSKYLTLASNGDLSFLEKENNYIFSETYKGARFQQTESQIFKEYAEQSKRLRQFKDGAAILADAFCEDGPPYQDVLDDYSSYMKKTSRATRTFDKEISAHSPSYIGHSYYVKSRNAIKAIRNVDSTHLDGLPISLDLAPEQFGANISGFTTMEKLMEETKQNARQIDTKEERLEYSKRPNIIQETGYKFFAKNQKGLAISLAAMVAIGAAAGIASQVKTAHDYNNLDIDTLSEKGYKSDLSTETISSIQNVEQTLKELQKQSTIPTEDQLRDVGSTLDDLFDDIIQEKLTPSFLDAHPEAKDVNVEHYYNYQDPEAPYKAVIITYTDSEGKKQEERVTHFSTASLFSSHDMENVFEHEYDIDGSYGDISSIFSSPGNYIENGKDVKEVLKGYGKSLDFMKHLSAVELNYKDGNLFGIIPSSIKSDIPEKTDTSSRSVDDEER